MTLDDQQSEIVTFAVFFSVLVSILLITVGYSILRIYTSPKDIRRVQLLQRDIDANHLADNFLSQCQLLYSFPLPWKSSTPFMSKFTPSLPTTTTTATSGTNPTAMKSHSFVFSTWISWMALLCFAIALILIIVACALGNLETGAVLKQTKLMYPAVIMLVISSNVFLLTRQSVYYSQKLKESWFINDLDTYQDVQHHNNQFHSISIRPYSLPNRLHEMEKHRYSCRPWSFQNMAQCALLFIEFLQWISFPLLDLLTLKNLRMVHPLPISIMRMFTFMTDPINTQLLFKLQFWTSFVFMVVGVLVVWVFYIVNHKLKKGWSLGWIFFLLPLTAFY
ncbi:hypothetical protein HMI55_000603 [Coelomomyces lativittatus]|nr:hypothetical protein HMI55_000603 [Coelomomyces lativittatus]